MTDHNPSKAHWGSQVDLTYLHGCRVSFYAQRKGFVHPLFGWISYKVWPQVSNGASTPLKQEEKTPLFRLKGVVVTFYGSLFSPLPPFSVTHGIYFFLSHYGIAEWHRLRTILNGIPFLLKDSFPWLMDRSWLEGSVPIRAVRVPCRELTLEKGLQISCRDSKDMSVSKTPTHHTETLQENPFF